MPRKYGNQGIPVRVFAEASGVSQDKIYRYIKLLEPIIEEIEDNA